MNRPKNYNPQPAGIPMEILCSAAASDRPPGVSILDALTFAHEISTGRKSQLPAHIIEKLEAHARLAAFRSETRSVQASISRPAPQAAKPTAPTESLKSGFITAKEFAGEPLKMIRSEFRKLTDADRSRYLREGGKLAEDPKPAR